MDIQDDDVISERHFTEALKELEKQDLIRRLRSHGMYTPHYNLLNTL
jgi:hypothetical protein